MCHDRSFANLARYAKESSVPAGEITQPIVLVFYLFTARGTVRETCMEESMVWSRDSRFPPSRERGAALIVVSFIMAIVLVGGLAAIAISSAELSSSRGYRTRQTAQACAQAGLEHARATLPDDTATGALGSLTYMTAHYGDSSATNTVMALEASSFDAASLYDGENVTNSLGGGGGSGGVQVMSVIAKCSGSGYGEREMQMIFRYGNPLAD